MLHGVKTNPFCTGNVWTRSLQLSDPWSGLNATPPFVEPTLSDYIWTSKFLEQFFRSNMSSFGIFQNHQLEFMSLCLISVCIISYPQLYMPSSAKTLGRRCAFCCHGRWLSDCYCPFSRARLGGRLDGKRRWCRIPVSRFWYSLHPGAPEKVMRHVIPADNSCLFNSVAYALDGAIVGFLLGNGAGDL